VFIVAFSLLRHGEKLINIALDFSVGALLTFAALLGENFAFSLFGPLIPAGYELLIKNFIFVALTEEVVKISQIVQLTTRRHLFSLQDTISVALVVAAGFAGAENVVYLFRYSQDVDNLLLLRTLTAVPLHLATAVVAAKFISIARQREQHQYYAVALLVATGIHGFYDYLVMASRGRSFSFVFVLGFVVAWAWRILALRKS